MTTKPPKTLTVDAEMKIAEIKVGDRSRTDLGDLEGIAGSVARIGLINPITVDKNRRLVTGARRLEAFEKILMRTHIPARTVDVPSIPQAEFEENFYHKRHTPSEIVKLKRKLEPALRKEANQRMREGKPSAKFSKGRVTDKIAKIARVSRP